MKDICISSSFDFDELSISLEFSEGGKLLMIKNYRESMLA